MPFLWLTACIRHLLEFEWTSHGRVPGDSGRSAPSATGERLFAFDRFRFNASTGELWRERDQVKLTPRAADVLALLVGRAAHVVTKQELFDCIWGGGATGDEALTSCIQELRKALDDDARHPRFIETRHRRGYRFVVPVTPPAARVSDKPSVAILPFHNLSPEPEQEYFADGLVEDLTAALSRIPSIFVVDRGSSFAFKGKSVRPSSSGASLGSAISSKAACVVPVKGCA